MRMKVLSFCLFIVLILISCKKEEIGTSKISTGTENSYQAKINKVLVDNQSISEYIYNDSSLVVQEKCKYDYVQYHYNSKGQLATAQYYDNDDILSADPAVAQSAANSNVLVTASSGNKGGLITYTYNDNGQLARATYTRPAATSSEYSEFTYTANRITRQTMYWDNTATGYIDYQYDANGNMVSEALYDLPASGSPLLITKTKYSFDNQLNPYRTTSRSLVPGINTNLNNIIKEVYTIPSAASQSADNVQTTETTYEYNAMGFPISQNGTVTFVY
jgi:hypothetical protein